MTIEAFAGYFEAWSKTDFATEVVGSGVAIKIIVGKHDLVFAEDVMRRTYLTQFPDAELEVMRNTRHYPMEEARIALAASIEAFFRERLPRCHRALISTDGA